MRTNKPAEIKVTISVREIKKYFRIFADFCSSSHLRHLNITLGNTSSRFSFVLIRTAGAEGDRVIFVTIFNYTALN